MSNIVEKYDLVRKSELDTEDRDGNIWEGFYRSTPEEYYWLAGDYDERFVFVVLAGFTGVSVKTPYVYIDLEILDRIKPVLDAAKKAHEVLKAENLEVSNGTK